MPRLSPRIPATHRFLLAAWDRDRFRLLEVEQVYAALEDAREREAKQRPDPRLWYERCTETEGGCPL